MGEGRWKMGQRGVRPPGLDVPEDGKAAGSETPHRQANALYCQGLLDHDGAKLLAAAGRYAALTFR